MWERWTKSCKGRAESHFTHFLFWQLTAEGMHNYQRPLPKTPKSSGTPSWCMGVATPKVVSDQLDDMNTRICFFGQSTTHRSRVQLKRKLDSLAWGIPKNFFLTTHQVGWSNEPAHSRVIASRWLLRILPTQTTIWFYDYLNLYLDIIGLTNSVFYNDMWQEVFRLKLGHHIWLQKF